jgi:hypothetical protein
MTHALPDSDMPMTPADFIAKLDEMKAASANRKCLVESLQNELAAKEADAAQTQRLLDAALARRTRTAALIALCDAEGDRIQQAALHAAAAASRLRDQRESLRRWAAKQSAFLSSIASMAPSSDPDQLVVAAWLSQPIVQQRLKTVHDLLSEFNAKWPIRPLLDAGKFSPLPPGCLSSDDAVIATWILTKSEIS